MICVFCKLLICRLCYFSFKLCCAAEQRSMCALSRCWWYEVHFPTLNRYAVFCILHVRIIFLRLHLFMKFTGGGLKKALKKKGSGEKRNLEESALSIAAQLICWLGQDHASSEAYPARLLNKLVEKDHEKLERCAELYGSNHISRFFKILNGNLRLFHFKRKVLAHVGRNG